MKLICKWLSTPDMHTLYVVLGEIQCETLNVTSLVHWTIDKTYFCQLCGLYRGTLLNKWLRQRVGSILSDFIFWVAIPLRSICLHLFRVQLNSGVSVTNLTHSLKLLASCQNLWPLINKLLHKMELEWRASM